MSEPKWKLSVPGHVKAVGLIAAFAIAVLLATVIWERTREAGYGECKAASSGGGAASLSIDAVQPAEFPLGASICVMVSNVVPDSARKAADDQVTAAETARATVLKTLGIASTAPGLVGTAPVLLTEANKDLEARRAERAALDKSRIFTLYLNGNKSPFTAEAQPIAAPQALRFRLRADTHATSDIGKFWREAFAAPRSGGRIDAQIGIAEEGKPIVPFAGAGKKEALKIILYNTLVRVLAIVALLSLLYSLVGLSIATPMLRTGDDLESSFSLARVQMMFWFVLVTSGFLYIWVVTGQFLEVMNTSSFALLGIAGVATGAAVAIDAPHDAPRKVGFFSDLATDGKDYIQLQRLQVMLWTIVLGGIYVWHFLAKFELADFDSNLLALAGIVNGVYLGLKTQEKNPVSTAAPVDDAAAARTPAAGGAVDKNEKGQA